MDGIKEVIGQKVYVILKSSRKYSGIVNSVEEGIVYLTDKFDDAVMFSISEISSLEVERE